MEKNKQKMWAKNIFEIQEKFSKKVLTSAYKFGIWEVKINIFFS